MASTSKPTPIMSSTALGATGFQKPATPLTQTPPTPLPAPPTIGVGLKTDAVAEQQMRQTIRDLVASVDPYVKLDADAEDMLLSVASEFVESTTNFAARLARHRGAESLEVKDLQLHLEKQHAIRVPGFATQDDIGKAPAFRGQNLPAGLSSNPGASSGNASNMNASSTTSAAMGVNAVTNLAGAGVSTAGIGGTTSVGVGGPIGAGGSAGNPSASGAGVGTGTIGSGTAKGKEKAPPPAPTLRSKRLNAVKQAQSQTK